MAKHDWAKIKAEYVESGSQAERPTLEELAQKYGVNASNLRSRAAKENWATESNIFTAKIQQKREAIVEDRINELASEQASFDMDCFNLVSRLRDQVAAILKAISEETRPDPRTLLTLVQSIAIVQKVGRVALGDDTQIIKHLTKKGYRVTEPGGQVEEAQGLTDEMVEQIEERILGVKLPKPGSICPETIRIIREDIYGVIM